MENPLLLFYFRFFKSFVFFPLSLEEFSAKRLQREHSQPVENHMFDSKSSKLSAQRAEEKGEKKEEGRERVPLIGRAAFSRKHLLSPSYPFYCYQLFFFSKKCWPFQRNDRPIRSAR